MTTFTPLPGDPATVRTRAQALVDAATAMGSAATELDRITGYSADTSGAVNALRQRVGDLASMVRKAETRYSGAGQALLTYATALEAAQQKANTAISAHNSTAGDVAAAQSKVDSTTYNPQDLHTTPQQVTDHQQAVDQLSHAQAVDNVHATDYNNAVNDLHTAANIAKNAIEHADDKSDLDNSWWDDVTSFISDIVNWSGWKEVLAVIKDIADVVALITTVLGVIAMFIPFAQPFAAALLAIGRLASLVSLGVTVIQAFRGEATWGEVAVGMLFLAAGGLGKLARGVKAAGGLKGAVSAGRDFLGEENVLGRLGTAGLRNTREALESANPIKAFQRMALYKNQMAPYLAAEGGSGVMTDGVRSMIRTVQKQGLRDYGYSILELTTGGGVAVGQQTVLPGQGDDASINIGVPGVKVGVGLPGSTYPGLSVNDGLSSQTFSHAYAGAH